MLLTKKASGSVRKSGGFLNNINATLGTVDRRGFLKRSGMVAGAGAFASQLPFSMVKRAEAVPLAEALTAGGKIEVKRTVCTHCSVGCAIDAVVQNGVWVRQEPVFDSPINLGAHCAKGAALREHGHGEYRLKYPMKLVDGKYKRITWEEAYNEIGDKLMKIRKDFGPDAVYWVGSSKRDFLSFPHAVKDDMERDVDLVAQRLKAAQQDYKEHHAKTTR